MRARTIKAVFAVMVALPITPLWARELSFDERVAAQRAIEQVYWDHRIWPKENPGPKPSLSTVMPDEVIRARVVDYIRKSNALEKWWHQPITAAQLQAELDRVASNTQDGQVLRELFGALGNDPDLIAETLARQTLVDRLVHNWYAYESRFHGELKKHAEDAVAACSSDACMKTMGGQYTETTWKLRSDEPGTTASTSAGARTPMAGDKGGTSGILAPGRDAATVAAAQSGPDTAVRLDADEWQSHLDRLAAKFGVNPDTIATGLWSRIEETSEAFFITALLKRSPSEIVTANAVWAKQSFDAWWAAERNLVGSGLEQPSGVFTLPAGPSTACTNDTWTPTRMEVPDPRRSQLTVWTGTEMIVWGGTNGPYLNSGGRYNPSTDTWTPTSTGANVPVAADFKTAVWTGTEMIVWGGYNGVFLNSGGRYNPSTDTWTATSTGSNVPAGRFIHTAVWTGTEMIVWGGTGPFPTLNSGGRYNPATNTWTTTSTGVNVPAARNYHTAVWTGTEMIVWGGYNGPNLNSGGRYNPTTDSWAATSSGVNVPAERRYHTAVWTGTEMIVWGGWDGSYLGSGGRYNPSTDAWMPTSTGTDAPIGRYAHTALWTGTEMIVYGGVRSGFPAFNGGGRYDPSSDTWKATATGPNVPAGREFHSAVWTGTEMIVWGGYWFTYVNSGGRYNPSTDTWTATSTGPNVPVDRYYHTTVWTGTEMIVWGGIGGFYLNSGGRYIPSTDSWTPTSTGTNVPAARETQTAVWTGTEMIVWGGYDGSYLNSGGRYSPSTDTWAATSTGANVPAGRYEHTTVWTGTKMLVWGGSNGPTLNSGGRYDPTTDTWAKMSTGANVPAVRTHHTTVWTGTEMIVWGGYDSGAYLNTGGRYDPTTDTWAMTSTGASVPAARRFTSAVWTGSEMIVWGGIGSLFYNSGARYNPSTNTWTATSTGTNVPDVRYYHTAVWTGAEMIVWGGTGGSGGSFLNSGGRYHPPTNTWTTTSTGTNDPAARYEHTAVWTGTEMIIWGGVGPASSGGRYCACPTVIIAHLDFDGDGYGDPAITIPTCEGSIPPGYVADGTDCNDASGAVHPGAAEVCNGFDDNCDGTVDNGENTLCGDGNVCTDDACMGLAGCAHTNNTGSCNDGNACTLSDACSAGLCVGSALDCSDGNACTLDTCNPLSGCEHAATCTESTSTNAPPGGTVTTDTEADGATPSDPIETGVTTPTGGTVTIQEGFATGPPHSGYDIFNVQVVITAQPATPADPLVLVFRLDASALPPAFVLTDLNVFKDGALVADCAGTPGTATPDPCVASRTLLGDADVAVTILTSTASTWNFAVPNCNDGDSCTVDSGIYPSCGHAQVSCVDGNPCTDDGCNPVSGCFHTANTSVCDDGNACTAGDACSGGSCQAGTPVSPPPEIAGLGVAGHEVSTLTWTNQGGSTVYDLVSSTLSDLRANGTVTAACLANDLTVASYMDSQTVPAPAAGYYYLVRAQVACGAGSYGVDSSGAPRLPASACP